MPTARTAFPVDQPRSGAMGTAGNSLVRARLYRGADRRLGADPPHRRRRSLWGGASARPPTASTICSSIARSASSSAVGSATCCSTTRAIISRIRSKSSKVWRRRHGLPRRSDRRRARRCAVRAPLSACRLLTVFDLASLVAPIGIFLGRLANFIKPELWGRPTDVPWAIDLPRLRRPAAPSEPDLRGALEGLGGVRRAVDRGARWARLRRPGLSPAASACSTARRASSASSFAIPIRVSRISAAA